MYTYFLKDLDAITVKDARPGRLVLNPLQPHQDFLDPPGTPEESITEVKDVQTFRNRFTATSLQSKFSNFLSTLAKNQNESVQKLSAQTVVIHKLNNSGKWFRESCGGADVREWVKSARFQGDQIYLITGYCALSDTHYDSTLGTTAVISGHVHVPISAAVDAGITLNVSADVAYDRKLEERTIAHFPGQMVCAVQYRKLKFKWLSPQELDTGPLKANRWKLTSVIRSKIPSSEEVVLEVDLAGESDEEDVDSDEEDEEN